MNLREFRQAGHLPSLVCAFLYFDVSFMIWVLIGALAPFIAANLALDPVRDAGLKGLMVAVPILGGAVLRLVLGVMTDHMGAKKTGMIGMTLTAVPLLLGWLWAESFGEVLLVGAMLGVAGASFAAALPLASRWYPPRFQGLAMGIAGAGNSGTALATLVGPVLAQAYGWHVVFGLALLPLTLTLTAFAWLAQDSPNQPPPKPLTAYSAVLGHADTWWFNLFYSVTFGGFVGLASFLSTFFKDQYFSDNRAMGGIYAGTFTTLCVISGSFLRPVGGYLADRFGGVRLLIFLYAGVATMMAGMSFLPPLAAAVCLLFAGMGMLGMGNGAVFQLVPLRFPREIGVMTGIVGAAGGVGGFFLPNVLGWLKQQTGSFGSGFAAFAVTTAVCAFLIWRLRAAWEEGYLARAGVNPAPAVPALSAGVGVAEAPV
jgi:NNP family nitrate/nitrite transporter-like MFS transporter